MQKDRRLDKCLLMHIIINRDGDQTVRTYPKNKEITFLDVKGYAFYI